MEKFKIGGKITLEDNTTYVILDILKFKGLDFLFCCTTQKPIEPKILHIKEENGEIYVKIEENPKVVFEISRIIMNKK